MGLAHARSLDPGGSRISPLGGPATENEYGHALDVMGIGRGPSAHFNTHAKARLGWLDAVDIAEGAVGGIYRLSAADGPSDAHPRALRIPTATGDSALEYWIEYRAGLPGALVQCTGYRDPEHPASPPGQTVWLLPAGDSRGPAPFLLKPGAIVTDAGTGLAFRVQAIADDSGWAEVEVIRPGTGVRIPPRANIHVTAREWNALGRRANTATASRGPTPSFRKSNSMVVTHRGSEVGKGRGVRAEGK